MVILLIVGLALAALALYAAHQLLACFLVVITGIVIYQLDKHFRKNGR
jgi:hypothetical protein